MAIPIECYNEKNEILYPNFEKCEYLASLLRWSWFFPDLIAGMKKEASFALNNIYLAYGNAGKFTSLVLQYSKSCLQYSKR